MIRLLDCTLRDGGYINDWKFGEKAIQNTVLDLTETGVDIIELGFLKNEPANSERTVFNEKKQMDKLIPPHEARMHYAAMIEVVNPIPLQMLQAYDGQGVDIIRVIVWKQNMMPMEMKWTLWRKALRIAAGWWSGDISSVCSLLVWSSILMTNS